MRAFRRVPEGLACGLDDWERELLARLALEVRALLQADAPHGAGQSETSSPSHPDPVRPGESERDREVLDALGTIDYDGWVSVEILPDDDLDAMARQAIRYMRPRIDAYNRRKEAVQ